MRNGILLAAGSIALLCPLAQAFTITPSFGNSSAQTWTAAEEAVVNQAIDDWTSVLSYSDPNQNINVNFQFVSLGTGGPTPTLGVWSANDMPVPPGTNVFPWTTGVSHTIFINTDFMTTRGNSYPNNVVLSFTSSPPIVGQTWDGLTVLQNELGQALGFTTYYTDSSGGMLSSNKWQDQVTINGSNVTFDQTPGGLNIPLTPTGIANALVADPNDLMTGAALPDGVRKNIGFQNLEALSLAYGYAITVNSGTSYSTPTFKTETITMNGTVAVTPTTATRGTPSVVLTTQNITFGGSGLLDISNHDMIIHGGQTLAQVQALVASGNGGVMGITSSTATTDGVTLAVGTAAGANVSTFDGLAVSPTDILIKYTFAGDANMDGQVTLTDLATVLNNFGQATPNWTSGNFDGATTIDLTDLADVLNNFGRNVPQTAASGVSPALAAPEPASLAALALAAPMLLRRRRVAY